MFIPHCSLDPGDTDFDSIAGAEVQPEWPQVEWGEASRRAERSSCAQELLVTRLGNHMQVGKGPSDRFRTNRAHPISSAAGETGSSLTGGSRRACDGGEAGHFGSGRIRFCFGGWQRGLPLRGHPQQGSPLPPPSAGHVLTCARLPIHSSPFSLSPIPSHQPTSILSPLPCRKGSNSVATQARRSSRRVFLPVFRLLILHRQCEQSWRYPFRSVHDPCAPCEQATSM